MKRILTASLMLASLGGFAQNCSFNLQPPAPDQYFNWYSSALLSDHGVMALGSNGLGSIHLTKWTPDGQVIWSKRLKHNNPAVFLGPHTIRSTPDGHVVISAYFQPNEFYESMCATKIDTSGAVEWARIYMLDSTYQDLGGTLVDTHPLPDGGFLLTSWFRHGLSASRLNSAGVPMWSKRYEPGSIMYAYGLGTVVDPSGEFLHYGRCPGSFYALHTDASGNVQWAHTWSLGLELVHDVARAANGDYLICGNRESDGAICLVRVDASGNFLWMKSYSGSEQHSPDVNELASGNIYLCMANGTPSLMELDATGTAIGAWDPNAMSGPTVGRMLSMSQVGGDSLIIGYTVNEGGASRSGLLVSTDPSSLSCALTPASLPTTTTEPGPSSIDDSMTTTPDSLKTWTMNLGDIQATNVLDLECYAFATHSVPGFSTFVTDQIKNDQGDDSGPITATLTFDPALSYQSAVPEPYSVVGNTVTWHLPPMGPYSERYVYTYLMVPADPSLIGTTLNHGFSAYQDSTEITLANNATGVMETVVGSYDPNEITVKPEGFYNITTDSILDYTVRFQNTGTASAVNVVVVDTLPLDVEVNSLIMKGASHPFTYSLTGNGILTVTFSNIQLADSTADEAGSHGGFNFTVKPVLPLALGQQISNTADIYFDFNPAIRTNTAVVTVAGPTGITSATTPPRLSVYPVPSKNFLNTVIPEGFKPVLAWAVGVDGRRLPMDLPTAKSGTIQLDLQRLMPGAYVLCLTDRTGKRMSARFIKE